MTADFEAEAQDRTPGAGVRFDNLIFTGSLSFLGLLLQLLNGQGEVVATRPSLPSQAVSNRHTGQGQNLANILPKALHRQDWQQI